MYSDLICDRCGFVMVYDAKNDWYIKCPCCDKVLVDVNLIKNSVDELVIVDYGKTNNCNWVIIRDKIGNLRTYWESLRELSD